MSKLLDALQKAQEARRQKAAEDSRIVLGGQPSSGRDAVWDHVRDLEEAFRRRDAQMAQQAAAAAGIAPQRPSGAVQEPAPAAPNAPTRYVPAAQQAPSSVPAPSQALEQRLAQIQEELIQCEQLAFRQQGLQASIRLQAAANEDLAKQLSQDQQALKQRLQQSDEATVSIEATRQFWQKQLDALLACQTLSRTASLIEEELALSRQLAQVLAQSRQRLSDEHTHYEDRCAQLQQLSDRLQTQLAQALAASRPTGGVSPATRPQPEEQA